MHYTDQIVGFLRKKRLLWVLPCVRADYIVLRESHLSVWEWRGILSWRPTVSAFLSSFCCCRMPSKLRLHHAWKKNLITALNENFVAISMIFGYFLRNFRVFWMERLLEVVLFWRSSDFPGILHKFLGILIKIDRILDWVFWRLFWGFIGCYLSTKELWGLIYWIECCCVLFYLPRYIGQNQVQKMVSLRTGRRYPSFLHPHARLKTEKMPTLNYSCYPIKYLHGFIWGIKVPKGCLSFYG